MSLVSRAMQLFKETMKEVISIQMRFVKHLMMAVAVVFLATLPLALALPLLTFFVSIPVACIAVGGAYALGYFNQPTPALAGPITEHSIALEEARSYSGPRAKPIVGDRTEIMLAHLLRNEPVVVSISRGAVIKHDHRASIFTPLFKTMASYSPLTMIRRMLDSRTTTTPAQQIAGTVPKVTL